MISHTYSKATQKKHQDQPMKKMKEVSNLMIENEQISAWPEEIEQLKKGKEIEKPSVLFQFKW